jgi:hypothetical protein
MIGSADDQDGYELLQEGIRGPLFQRKGASQTIRGVFVPILRKYATEFVNRSHS